MRRAINIQSELNQIHTVEDLTEVFESIASIHIARIRNRVVASKEFFAELWPTYSSLRVSPHKQLARQERKQKGRNVFLAITAEGKLGGEVDEKIISQMLQAYKTPTKTDIMVVGSRGATQLALKGIPIARAFALPQSDININVTKIIQVLAEYDKISVFYQTYESLRTQKIARIDLVSIVRDLGQDIEEDSTVNSQDYIFEPSVEEIADYMESVMMGVALIQIIMESKLAGYASRFNSMNLAKHRAGELVVEFRKQFYRAKRSESDERLKEITKSTKAQRLRSLAS